MTARYASHVSTKTTPQSEKIPGSKQERNSAGGWSHILDCWKRLDRFLILGSDKSTYYVSERKLTQDNAECVVKCGIEDGKRAVDRVVEISEQGRAPKNDSALFALALLSSSPNMDTRRYALSQMSKVARIGTHLFQFVDMVSELRGNGRGLNRALKQWYTEKSPADLAYQCVKYQSRTTRETTKTEKGKTWSHRDILRLCKPKAQGTTNDIFHWICKGWEGVGEQPHPDKALRLVWAYERVKKETDPKVIVKMIRDYGLTREMLPTECLNSKEVWEALLDKMPMHAMIRNLGKMTSLGLISPLSRASRAVCEALSSQEAIKRSRLHPMAILGALRTYGEGHGARAMLKVKEGREALGWTPDQKVMDALDEAFHLAFGNVQPSNKRHLLALDVSGSMGSNMLSGIPGMSAKDASAAMAMITLRLEPECHVIGFTAGSTSGYGYDTAIKELSLSKKDRLDTAMSKLSGIPFGRTDCSLPMLYCIEKKLSVDMITVITDNETYANNEIHPSQALVKYREALGVSAKLVVVGMTSTQFSIADPNDLNSLDVVGFDTATPQVISDFAMGLL